MILSDHFEITPSSILSHHDVLDPSREISPGEECLLIFADCCIVGWQDTSQPTLPPASRSHDLSDAFAFVGFFSKPGTA